MAGCPPNVSLNCLTNSFDSILVSMSSSIVDKTMAANTNAIDYISSETIHGYPLCVNRYPKLYPQKSLFGRSAPPESCLVGYGSGLAQDETGADSDLLPAGDPTIESVVQRTKRLLSQLVARKAHRGEGRLREFAELDVVKSHYRNVLRDSQPAAVDGAHCADSRQVIGCEYCGWRVWHR